MFSTEVLIAALMLTAQASSVTVDSVRTQTRMLLQSMCDDRCDVVDVQIKKRRRAPVGGVEPGFDDAPQLAPVPSEIALTLLFDSKITKAHRAFISDRVKHRISEMGLPVLVTENVRPFPDPLPFPEEPQPAIPPPPPPAAPVIVQPPAPAAPAPAPVAAKADLEETFWLEMIKFLPVLLMFLLLGWFLMRVLKRMENLTYARGYEEEPEHNLTVTPEVIEDRTGMPVTAQPLPPPRSDELVEDLRLYRGSTRRIFRRLLVQGDHDTVARSVALLGDFVVQDLSHDPDVKKALGAAGARTSEILRSPITDEEREDLLRTVQAELVADRVANRAEDVREEFEQLLGWGPEAFAALLSRLDERLEVIMLRHAPGHLTESYLRGMSPSTRAAAVRKLLEAPAAEPSEIEVLAAAIETQAQAALVGGYEADHIVDLLDSLPASEQESVVSDLESTRPDYVRRNLGQLPVESALLRVPDEALAAAWAKVPFEDWLAYLRVAPQDIRARALHVCPARLRESVTEELTLRVAGDPVAGTRARRKIIQAALGAVPSGALLDAPLQVPAKT